MADLSSVLRVKKRNPSGLCPPKNVETQDKSSQWGKTTTKQLLLLQGVPGMRQGLVKNLEFLYQVGCTNFHK
jgi:hypothetical protein